MACILTLQLATGAAVAACHPSADSTSLSQTAVVVDRPPGSVAATLASSTIVLYSQPPHPSGGLLQSSLRDPNGSDTDQWVWDGFTLASSQTISEIRWKGGYDPARLGSGGPVADFTVDIFSSIPAGTQPDLSRPPLVHYPVGSNASETAGAVIGGQQMYEYGFTLPTPFRASAGAKYWVQIEAFQPGPSPDWGITLGTGGDGIHFLRVAGETLYRQATGDASFTLLGTGVQSKLIYLPVV